MMQIPPNISGFRSETLLKIRGGDLKIAYNIDIECLRTAMGIYDIVHSDLIEKAVSLFPRVMFSKTCFLGSSP